MHYTTCNKTLIKWWTPNLLGQAAINSQGFAQFLAESITHIITWGQDAWMDTGQGMHTHDETVHPVYTGLFFYNMYNTSERTFIESLFIQKKSLQKSSKIMETFLYIFFLPVTVIDCTNAYESRNLMFVVLKTLSEEVKNLTSPSFIKSDSITYVEETQLKTFKSI